VGQIVALQETASYDAAATPLQHCDTVPVFPPSDYCNHSSFVLSVKLGVVMRINRWVNLLALLCVLLHAGLVVRHNHTVLAAILQQDLPFSYGIICQTPASGQSSNQPSEHSSPLKKISICPICFGAVPGAALAGPGALEVTLPAPCALPPKMAAATAVTPQFRAVLPPSQAPPATV
jgi:hypothetical protein